MRIGEALREAGRDIRTGAGRSVLFAVLFSVCAGGLALAAGLGQAQVIRSAQAYVSAGAATYVMKADDRIDGRACDALATHASVQAAGALRERERPLVPSALPQTPITSFETSAGFADVLDSGGQRREAGIDVSTDVAEVLGIRPGDRLSTGTGEATVSRVFRYPDDGRDSLLAFAAVGIVPLGEAPFDACWATIWPQDEEAVAALGRSVLSGSGRADEATTLMQLNQTKGTRFAEVDFLGQAAANGLTAGTAVALGVLYVLRRRLSLASDRHIGVARFAQVVSQTVQASVWAITGTVLVGAVSLCIYPSEGADRVPLVSATLLTMGVGASMALASCALTTCLISERSLFRYFKNR